jgi:hypothetical protein
MHTQGWVSWAVQLAVFVRIAHPIVGLGMPQIGGLREELCGVALVQEDVVAVTRLVQAAEVVRRRIVDRVSRLGG